MNSLFKKIVLFCGLSLGLGSDAWACGQTVANEAPQLNRWEQVLGRLAGEGVLSGALSEIDTVHFGFEGGGPLGAIPLGTLTMTQFGDGLDEARTVIPGLIYTQLILRWAQWIGEDYGPTKGQLFALMMLNPDQRLQGDVDDAGVELGLNYFRSGPSLYDLSYLRKQGLKESQAQWEKLCWANVSPALAKLRSTLKAEVLAFDELHHRLRRAPGLSRIVDIDQQSPRQRRYDFEYEVTGTLVSGIGEESPYRSSLEVEVGLRESGLRASAPYVVLDVWGYGTRGEKFREHMATVARYNDRDLAVALAIQPQTAKRMLADIEALRLSVNEVFGGGK